MYCLLLRDTQTSGVLFVTEGYTDKQCIVYYCGIHRQAVYCLLLRETQTQTSGVLFVMRHTQTSGVLFITEGYTDKRCIVCY